MIGTLATLNFTLSPGSSSFESISNTINHEFPIDELESKYTVKSTIYSPLQGYILLKMSDTDMPMLGFNVKDSIFKITKRECSGFLKWSARPLLDEISGKLLVPNFSYFKGRLCNDNEDDNIDIHKRGK